MQLNQFTVSLENAYISSLFQSETGQNCMFYGRYAKIQLHATFLSILFLTLRGFLSP